MANQESSHNGREYTAEVAGKACETDFYYWTDGIAVCELSAGVRS